MTRKECLDAAAEAVLTSRAHEYGDGPEDSFSQIAKLWSAYFGIQFTTVDVAMALVMVKMARIRKNPHHDDSWTDLAGYAACGAECAASMCESECPGDEHDEQQVPGIRAQNLFFLAELDRRMAIAERKHPLFADGVYQGLGVVTEEVGELSQAANKQQGKERLAEESWDVAVVAARFARGDWRQKSEL